MMLSAFPAMVPQQHGAHTVLTGLLDRSALYGVLAEIDALGLDLLEVRQLERDADHQNQVTAAHRDGLGLALLPLTVIMLALSARSGQLASQIGPRLQLSAGPFITGADLAMLTFSTSGSSYVTYVLPAVLGLRARARDHGRAAHRDRDELGPRRSTRASLRRSTMTWPGSGAC